MGLTPKDKVSAIQLYDGVPFDSTTNDIIWFDTLEHQNQFWSVDYCPWFKRDSSGGAVADRYYSNLQLVFEDRRIKLECDYFSALQVNYLRYQNPSMGSKWFYCFVDTVTYISDAVTEFHVTADLWQTHMFDFQFDTATYIERMTVPNDSRTLYRQSEDMSFSPEYVYAAVTINNDVFKPNQITMLSTADPSTGSNVVGDTYEGVYSGAKRYNYTSASGVNSALSTLTSNNKSASVVSLCITPSAFVDTAGKISTTRVNIGVSTAVKLGTFRFTDPYNFIDSTTPDYYIPQNKKMMQSPYNALYLTDFQGDDVVYKYEDFPIDDTQTSPAVYFDENGVFNGSFEGNITPIGYEGITYNYGKQMQVKCGTTCCWTYDAYQAELAQKYAQYSAMGDGILGAASYIRDNASSALTSATSSMSSAAANTASSAQSKSDEAWNNFTQNSTIGNAFKAFGAWVGSGVSSAVSKVATSAATTVATNSSSITESLSIVTSFATGVKSAIDGVASSILSYMRSDAMPLSINGNPQPSLMTSLAATKGSSAVSVLHAYTMKIMPQLARVMDSYFTLYGYKIGCVSTPTIKNRQVMSFLKTSNCHLEPVPGAYITADRLAALSSMFDVGVRAWHCWHTGSTDVPVGSYTFDEFLNQYRCSYIDNTTGYSSYAWARGDAPVYRDICGLQTNTKPTTWFREESI